MEFLRSLGFTSWAEFVVVAGFTVGPATFLISRFLNLRAKNAETRHSLFQTHKILAINEFIEAYTKLQHTFRGLSKYDILKSEISAVALDEIIFPPLDRLERSIYNLHLYLDDQDIELFNNIYGNLKVFNETVSKLYFQAPYSAEEFTVRSNHYSISLKEMINSNNEVLSRIGDRFRKSFQ